MQAMFTINWFITESVSEPFGQPRQVCYAAEAAIRQVARLKEDRTVIHIQIKGPGVDQGWVRNEETGAWSQQYDHIAAANV
jgi:hypothetical protein